MEEKSGYVVVHTNEEIIEGFLIPSKDDAKIILKLNSGYNISIEKDKIKKIETIKKIKEKKEVKFEKMGFQKNLPVISILHFGGTIASRIDYDTGAVSSSITPEELVSKFPEIKKIANIKSRLIRNMSSEDINFKHYNLLAKEIQNEIKDRVDGIIITHGTDTMHYTSAALSFVLEDLPIPIILVGSQRSSDRGSSDSYLNLICAIHFITKTDFAEVAICMHNSISDDDCAILPGTKTRKLHSSRRDAFKAVNIKPYALVSINGSISVLNDKFKKREPRKLKLKLFKEVKVGILKSYPGMLAGEFKKYSSYDGLIIEGTGLGHLPINKVDNLTLENEKIFLELKKLAKKIPVVITSQTVFGRINLNVYSPGRRLKEIGILGDYCDMTSETAYIKLAWLLSNYKKEEVKSLIDKDFRGEISKRLTEEFI